MTPRPKPVPDDVPSPALTNPTRLARELEKAALTLARTRNHSRSLVLYLAEEPSDAQPTARECLAVLAATIAKAVDQAVDLATAIRVGAVKLDERYLDPSCAPPRPLLDIIEGKPVRHAAEAIAATVAVRPPDGPGWNDAVDGWDPLRVPPEHPAAKSARGAAARRKAGKAPGVAQDESTPAAAGGTTSGGKAARNGRKGGGH